uniref:Uncharacterized protein n=1 Tax=Anguilla anguilla TaxID=7936 RepID=A0A0E9UEA8_ANGAN
MCILVDPKKRHYNKPIYLLYSTMYF